MFERVLRDPELQADQWKVDPTQVRRIIPTLKPVLPLLTLDLAFLRDVRKCAQRPGTAGRPVDDDNNLRPVLPLLTLDLAFTRYCHYLTLRGPEPQADQWKVYPTQVRNAPY